jgi:hypothetical protein
MTTPNVGTRDPYSSVVTSSTAHTEETIIKRHISWGSVFAGAVVAMVVQVMFTFLGMGIGANAVDPSTTSASGAQAAGAGSAIWMGGSLLVSLAVGSWVTGRVSSAPKGADAIIHGLVVWGVTTLAAVYLATSMAAALIGGVTSAVGSAAQTAAVTAPAYTGSASKRNNKPKAPDPRSQAALRAAQSPWRSFCFLERSFPRSWQMPEPPVCET